MGLRIYGDRVYFSYSWRVGPLVFNNVAATGELARAMAEWVERERERKRVERAAERAERERWERTIVEYCDAVETIARAVLIATGHHQHKGEWRMARSTKASVPAKRKKKLPPWTEGDRSEGWYGRCVASAEAGDRAALEDLRGYLATLGPEDVEPYGIAGQLEESLIRQGDPEIVTREWFRVEIRRLRDEIAGANPTPIERLLAERIAFCWFEANRADRNLAEMGAVSFEQARYNQHRATSAQRRLLMAIRTLATVREKALPELRRTHRFDGLDLIPARPSANRNGTPRACLESDG